ncbi:MAG: hypothetical protein AAB676_11325 [Verrucomicrobiota bacterium]
MSRTSVQYRETLGAAKLQPNEWGAAISNRSGMAVRKTHDLRAAAWPQAGRARPSLRLMCSGQLQLAVSVHG